MYVYSYYNEIMQIKETTKMEVEIISKECIKPSSPTPLHLKNHKLSFLDQHVGYGYANLVLYYPANQDTNFSPSEKIISERLQLLKESLAETLSRFYPFAGKIKEPAYSIDCNDEGVYFIEAKVKSPLKNFLNPPNISLLNKFIPGEGKWKAVAGDHVAGVQVTKFACGGITVGFCSSHMIADAVGFGSFLKSWAAIARKNTEQAVHPKFDTASLFPSNEAYSRQVTSDHLVTSFATKLGKYISKRYVFDASAIAKLKAVAKSSSVPNPTRVEVVTALFAKCIMPRLKARVAGSDKPIIVNLPVNLRRKAIPQFSEDYMGNFPWLASVLCKDNQVELKAFVSHLREATSKLNGDFVNRLQGENGWSNFLEAVKDEREIFSNPAHIISFIGWCNIGLYDLDFGWGKPAWVSLIDNAENACVNGGLIFMDTREKDGIEAWVIMLEEDVAALERDQEFLSFATINPSIDGVTSCLPRGKIQFSKM